MDSSSYRGMDKFFKRLMIIFAIVIPCVLFFIGVFVGWLIWKG